MCESCKVSNTFFGQCHSYLPLTLPYPVCSTRDRAATVFTPLIPLSGFNVYELSFSFTSIRFYAQHANHLTEPVCPAQCNPQPACLLGLVDQVLDAERHNVSPWGRGQRCVSVLDQRSPVAKNKVGLIFIWPRFDQCSLHVKMSY